MGQLIPVFVQVETVDGAAVDGAFLTFEASDPPLPEVSLVTDSKGKALLALPQGSYRLMAQKGASRGTQDFQIDANSPPQNVAIVLKNSGRC